MKSVDLHDFALTFAKRTGRVSDLTLHILCSMESGDIDSGWGPLLLGLLERADEKDICKSEVVWRAILATARKPVGTLPRELLYFLAADADYTATLESYRLIATEEGNRGLLALVSLPLAHVTNTRGTRPLSDLARMICNPDIVVFGLSGNGFDAEQVRIALRDLWPHGRIEEVGARGARQLLTFLTEGNSSYLALVKTLHDHFTDHMSPEKKRQFDVSSELRKIAARDNAGEANNATFRWI